LRGNVGFDDASSLIGIDGIEHEHEARRVFASNAAFPNRARFQSDGHVAIRFRNNLRWLDDAFQQRPSIKTRTDGGQLRPNESALSAESMALNTADLSEKFFATLQISSAPDCIEAAREITHGPFLHKWTRDCRRLCWRPIQRSQ